MAADGANRYWGNTGANTGANTRADRLGWLGRQLETGCWRAPPAHVKHLPDFLHTGACLEHALRLPLRNLSHYTRVQDNPQQVCFTCDNRPPTD